MGLLLVVAVLMVFKRGADARPLDGDWPTAAKKKARPRGPSSKESSGGTQETLPIPDQYLATIGSEGTELKVIVQAQADDTTVEQARVGHDRAAGKGAAKAPEVLV